MLEVSAIYSYSFKKATLSLSWPAEQGASCVRVAQADSVEVQLANDGQWLRARLLGLRLQPVTCSGLRRSGQRRVELSLSASVDADAAWPERRRPGGGEAARRLLSEAKSLLCGFCGERLADMSGVARVAELSGADSLQELASSFFCHVGKEEGEGEEEEKEKRRRQLVTEAAPRAGECRYDGLELLLPGSALVASELADAGRHLVTCRRCGRVVGQRSLSGQLLLLPTQLRLLRDLLDVDGDIVGEEAVDLQPSSRRYLSWLLLSLCQGEASRRLVLLSASPAAGADAAVEEEAALLWLLDGKARVYSCQLQLQQQQEQQCRGTAACRLLYLPSSHAAFGATASLWSRDVSVGSLRLPGQLAAELLLLLAESSGRLAPEFRRINEFYCGFVPAA